jgi:hypothetical protein
MVEDLLDQHAEALFHGEDTTDALIRQHGDQAPVLIGLLRLTQRLYRTLVRVEPSERFVKRLGQRLERSRTQQAQSAARWMSLRERTLSVSRLLGIAVLVFAVVAVAVRMVVTLTMVVMLLMGRRRRSAAITG